MEVHLYIHADSTSTKVVTKLDRIIQMLQILQKGVTQMAASVDDVILAVQKETTVEQSVITLLNQFASQVQANITDPIKLQAVLDAVTANTTALAAAVTANTPVVPTPVPVPPVVSAA